VILQLFGVGYIIAGSMSVTDAADFNCARGEIVISCDSLGSDIMYLSPSGKLNFCCQCNKGVVVFDSMKTHSVGSTFIVIMKRENRQQFHDPAVLLQQNDLPVTLERRL
jgi:hypothetical protein